MCISVYLPHGIEVNTLTELAKYVYVAKTIDEFWDVDADWKSCFCDKDVKGYLESMDMVCIEDASGDVYAYERATTLIFDGFGDYWSEDKGTVSILELEDPNSAIHIRVISNDISGHHPTLRSFKDKKMAVTIAIVDEVEEEEDEPPF